MKFLSRGIIKIVIFLFTFSSVAYALSPAEELSSELNKIQTMKASFTQTIYDNHGKAVQQAQGKMALQRPGKFRWDVTTPTPQLIITNQNKMWIYDPDLEQVTIRALSRAMGSTPAFLLSQTITDLDKEYQITKEHGAFQLIPRQENDMFASLKIIIQQEQITDIYFRDHLDHTTKIHFAAIQNNTSLAGSLFIFKAPTGVDVIDETKK